MGDAEEKGEQFACSPLFSPSQNAAFESGQDSTITLLTQRGFPGTFMEMSQDELLRNMYLDAFASEPVEDDPIQEALLEEAFRIDREKYCLRCKLLKAGLCECPPWKLNIRMSD
jgi:hypothetical protein